MVETDSAPMIKFAKRPTNIEKQVTLEDQAICGALQTLNEEAFEDVIEERQADMAASAASAAGDSLAALGCGYGYPSNVSTCSDPAETDVLYLQTSVVPDLTLTGLNPANSVFGSRCLIGKFNVNVNVNTSDVWSTFNAII